MGTGISSGGWGHTRLDLVNHPPAPALPEADRDEARRAFAWKGYVQPDDSAGDGLFKWVFARVADLGAERGLVFSPTKRLALGIVLGRWIDVAGEPRQREKDRCGEPEQSQKLIHIVHNDRKCLTLPATLPRMNEDLLRRCLAELDADERLIMAKELEAFIAELRDSVSSGRTISFQPHRPPCPSRARRSQRF